MKVRFLLRLGARATLSSTLDGLQANLCGFVSCQIITDVYNHGGGGDVICDPELIHPTTTEGARHLRRTSTSSGTRSSELRSTLQDRFQNL